MSTAVSSASTMNNSAVAKTKRKQRFFFFLVFFFFFFLTAVSVVGRQAREKGILQRACDCCALSFAGKHRDKERCCVKTGALLMGGWVGGWRRGLEGEVCEVCVYSLDGCGYC